MRVLNTALVTSVCSCIADSAPAVLDRAQPACMASCVLAWWTWETSSIALQMPWLLPSDADFLLWHADGAFCMSRLHVHPAGTRLWTSPT